VEKGVPTVCEKGSRSQAVRVDCVMQQRARIIEADLSRPEHRRDVLALTQLYASDPMGSGELLPPDVLDRLIPGLQSHPTTLILLAYVDADAVGIATCFRGFSTFHARPLLNIHDLAVAPAWRGRGVGQQLLAAVERNARDLGCCKVTLEVQENNARARRLYALAGFAQAIYGQHTGGALFYTKPL
jgi:GNAT superfamily N-acetyltransferase